MCVGERWTASKLMDCTAVLWDCTTSCSRPGCNCLCYTAHIAAAMLTAWKDGARANPGQWYMLLLTRRRWRAGRPASTHGASAPWAQAGCGWVCEVCSRNLVNDDHNCAWYGTCAHIMACSCALVMCPLRPPPRHRYCTCLRSATCTSRRNAVLDCTSMVLQVSC